MIKVRVTREDIRRGVQTDGHECAIARAAKRKIGGKIAVGSFYVYEGSTMKPIYELSKSAQKFINKFDAGRNVKPATFCLKEV